jgi:hypothetical protein
VKRLLNGVVPPEHGVSLHELDHALAQCQETFQDAERGIVEWQDEIRSIRRRTWAKRHHLKDDPNLVVGAYVMLAREASGAPTTSKLQPPWYGPHKIIDFVNPNTVRVQLLGSDLIETAVLDRVRFFESKDVDPSLEMQKFADNTRPGDYVVDQIVGVERFGRNKWKFQVKWADSSQTLEPVTRLYHDLPHVVEKYLDTLELGGENTVAVKGIRAAISASEKRRYQD